MRLDNIKCVVLLLCGFACMQRAAAQVPVEKEAHHKIVLENEWVRVLEGHVPPHDTTPAHIHSANSVVVFLSSTGLGIRVAGQEPTVTPVAPGDLRYVNYGDKPVTHIVWDQGDSTLRFLVVELKRQKRDSCPMGPRPDIKLRLQQKQVTVYDWTPASPEPAPAAGASPGIPAASDRWRPSALGACPSSARMVIVPATGAFTFYPPNTPVLAQTRCLVLEF